MMNLHLRCLTGLYIMLPVWSTIYFTMETNEILSNLQDYSTHHP